MFSLSRFLAVVIKEFLQLKRDPLTMSMMLTVPLMQLLLFGFAINNDPHRLPTALFIGDDSPQARGILSALEATNYFSVDHVVTTRAEGDRLLMRGEVQFMISVPPGFGRDLVRGDRPQLLIEADASDPTTIASALASAPTAIEQALGRDLKGPLAVRLPAPGPVDPVLHRLYNPEGLTRYNIVPGLMGVVLFMTMVMMTAMAVTRERERGTLENLLAMPISPFELMLGKICPFIGIGAVQVAIIMIVAKLLFGVPLVGSVWLVAAATMLFIAVNLALGFTISTMVDTQLQASQASFMPMLPSMMLSGFMFPFRGMPDWAQWLGECLPMTHFLRIVRGVFLKGAGLADCAIGLGALALMLVIVMAVAMSRYRQTLD